MSTSYCDARHALRCPCSWWAWAVLLATLAGCGYTVVGSQPGDTMKRIALAVPPVLNQSREPGLESRVTAAMRQAILQSHTLSLMPEAVASRHLYGVVQRFLTSPVSFDESDNVVQYRIESQMRIRLVEQTSRRPLIDQSISAWTEYLISTMPDAARENVVAREAAILRLAQQLADKCTALLEVTLL